MAEPAPKPGKQNVTELAIALLPKMLEERNQLGIQRYGTSLQTWNGRNPIQDALEENLDLFQYLVQANMERTDTDVKMGILLRLRNAVVEYFKATNEIEILKASHKIGSSSWEVDMEDATGRLKESRRQALRAIDDSANNEV